jgi:heptosyltransferase-2
MSSPPDEAAAPAAPLHPSLARVAVICPTWIGDTVMATPVLRALRRALPEARLVALMPPGHDELLRGAPWLDECIPLNWRGLRGPVRVGTALRSRNVQAVLLLPNSFRSALGARLSGAHIRVGYDRDARGFLLTHRLPVRKQDRPTPVVDYYIRLARYALAAQAIDPRPELVITEDQHRAGDAALMGMQKPFVLLIPGASKPEKRWPAGRFAAVADALAESHGFCAAVSGAPSETRIIQSVIESARAPVVDLLTRRLPLGALLAVIRRAAIVITNDTGPRHIAAALGTPTVALFGPTDHRWTTLPDARERLLLAEPFLPDTLIADRRPKLCAIERISTADVIAAASALLDEPDKPVDASRAAPPSRTDADA